MHVLVTGAFGKAAFSIVEALKEAGHEIRGFDLPDAACPDRTRGILKDIILGRVENFEEVEIATRNIDAVVHLAIAGGSGAYNNPDVPFDVNVKGTYNVFEASRRNGVEKIIHLSSAPVHVSLRKDEMISAMADWRSSEEDSPLYDLTKRLQETIARDYCETHGMTTIVLRAGHIVDGRSEKDLKGRSLSTLTYCRGGWICRYDLASACLKALDSGKVGYHAFHVIGSDRAKYHFDTDRTEKELGLIFQNRFDHYH